MKAFLLAAVWVSAWSVATLLALFIVALEVAGVVLGRV